ncbi:hypothetical protein DFJ73DRAFT_852702 [Zopfochytrium polystomum]|nr:hypothetical protein DFJ73DRAFT_852702 [Zopfochytrium polystomum]
MARSAPKARMDLQHCTGSQSPAALLGSAAMAAGSITLVATLLALTANAVPAPPSSNHRLSPRDPAPFPAPAPQTTHNNDGLCGRNVGSCYPGFCCSIWGYCGNSPDHCGSGCQSDYGVCTSARTATTSSVSSGGATVASFASTSSTISEGSSLASTTITSGPTTSVTSTASQTTSSGGSATTSSASPTTSSSPPSTSTETTSSSAQTTTTSSASASPTFVSTTGQCGDSYGLCPLGLCCGEYGWCGSEPSSCSVSSGCDKRYGDCDGFPQDPNINIVYGCRVPGTVAITFDDGPYTTISTIANAFKAAGARTTFFVNGDNADCIFDHAAALLAAYTDGHQIGAHTWSHPDIATLSEAELRREMGLLESAVKMITGARPNFFRPPFGSYNKTSVDIVADLGYTHFVLWDMTPQETSNGRDQSTSADVKNEKQTYNEADLSVPHIFLQHSQIKKTVSDMVPFIISWAQSKNLSMVTVADCLGTGAPKYRDVGQPTAKNASWTCDI